MKKILRNVKIITALTLMVSMFNSCSDDSDNGNDNSINKEEITSVLAAEGVSNVVDTIITDLFAENGTSGKQGATNKTSECHSIVFNENGYTATFNNCVLNGTDNVNGSVDITFSIENEIITYTATYDAFYVGDIKIDGTKSFTVTTATMQSEVSFTVLNAITISMADGSVVSENGTKTIRLTTGATDATSTFTVEGDWTLKVDETTYAIAVQNILEGNLACEHFTAGVMSLSKNGLLVKVNFGDGTCDANATVIYPNGITEAILLEE